MYLPGALVYLPGGTGVSPRGTGVSPREHWCISQGALSDRLVHNFFCNQTHNKYLSLCANLLFILICQFYPDVVEQFLSL